MEQKLQLETTKLLTLLKFASLFGNILTMIVVNTIYIWNFKPSINYIYGYVEFTMTSLLGFQIIVRYIFISIFICQKYIIIFNEINTEIIECFNSFEKNSNDLKSYFNKYYKCCDSYEISNNILKRIYIVLLGCFSPVSCYCVYYLMYGNGNIYINLLILTVVIYFITFALILSIMISIIDIEAKKALHVNPCLSII